MSIPQQILDTRQLNATDDTDIGLVNEVKEYNVKMNDCLARMKTVRRVTASSLILGVIVHFVYVSECLLDNGFLSYQMVLALISAAAFVVFGIIGKKMHISAFAGILLIIAVPSSLIAEVVNILLALYQAKQYTEISKEPDFPKFRDIVIIYEKTGRFRSQRREEGEAALADIETVAPPEPPKSDPASHLNEDIPEMPEL